MGKAIEEVGHWGLSREWKLTCSVFLFNPLRHVLLFAFISIALPTYSGYSRFWQLNSSVTLSNHLDERSIRCSYPIITPRLHSPILPSYAYRFTPHPHPTSPPLSILPPPRPPPPASAHLSPPFLPGPQILRRGDLQINAPERTAHLHSLTREIATLIASMTVDPTVSPPRKHTVTIIEKTMSELGYNVRADRPAKAQALELIKRLGEEGSPLSVKRVRMRVRVTVPGKDWKRGGVRDRVMAEVEEVEGEETGMEWEGVSGSSWVGSGSRVAR